MNFEQVQQILAIVKHLNLSKAAKELYISQPALSLALSRLEKEIGVRLFYRDGNKLVLSPAGENLTSYFNTLKDTYDQLLSKASILRQEREEYISVGFAGSAMLFLTFFVTDFLNSYEDKIINKVFASRNQLIYMLKNGQIDFAISNPPLDDGELSHINILSENIGLAVSSGHPLAEKQKVRFKELSDIEFIGMKKTHSLRHVCDELCALNGFQPVYVKECEYREYFRVIAESRGKDSFVAFCPHDSFAGNYGEGFVYIDIDAPKMFRLTALSWHTERKLQYEYKKLVEHIIENYPAQHEFNVKYNARVAGELCIL